VRNPYSQLLAIKGTRGFVSAGFVGRLPMSMMGLGTVLLVQSSTGSYGVAGAVAACLAIASSSAAPLVGRWIDRLGQARVLLPSLAVHTVGLLTLLAAAHWRTPRWSLFATATITGIAIPPVSSCVRARWALVAPDTARLQVAYALESVLDEVIFIVGPVLVTLLATAASPAVAVASTLAFVATGVLTFAAQRGTEPAPSARPAADRAATAGPADDRGNRADRRRRSAIGVPGVRVVVTAFVALGAVFGALEVSMVAFAGEQGARGAAGPLLAVLAGASLCAGVVYGARGWRAPLHRRFAVALGLLAVGVVPLAIVDSVPLMAAAAVLAGLAVSPSLISGYGLVERLSPSGALTEGLTWVSTAVGLGIAIGSSASGQLVDLRGAGWGFAVCLAGAAAAAVVGLSGHRVLRSAADPNPVLVPPAALEARAGRVGTASGTASSSSGRRS
jgi:MFS family permease